MKKRLRNSENMKVVMYHADHTERLKFKNRLGVYKEITKIFKENVNSFGYDLVHLTTTGHEQWGDENYSLDLDPVEINYNRELCYIDFLKNHAEDNMYYWFTEPDWKIVNKFPPLLNDADFLLRNDIIPLHPGWRLAKKSALPIFEKVLECFYLPLKTWGGDSAGMATFYEALGKPTAETVYNGLTIGFRDYGLYGGRRTHYTQQYKADHKFELIRNDNESR